MKKILAFILSVLIIFGTVTMSACDMSTDTKDSSAEETEKNPSKNNKDDKDNKDDNKDNNEDDKNKETEKNPNSNIKDPFQNPSLDNSSNNNSGMDDNTQNNPDKDDAVKPDIPNDKDDNTKPSTPDKDDNTPNAPDTQQTFCVTFWSDDGIVQEITLPYGTLVVQEPEVPEPPVGYTNGRWQDYSINNEDVSVYPQYDAIKYTAYFKDGETLITTRSFTVEDTYISNFPSNPTKNGYTGRWSSYTIGAGNIEIQAIWSANTYNITYAGIAAATHSNPATYTPDGAVTLTGAVREGSEFIGWYDKNDQLVTVIPEGTTGDMTLTAKWNILYTAGLSYTQLTDGTWEVSGIGVWQGTEIYIPATHGGVAVTSIADSAFRYNHDITEVSIPDSVTSIGRYAFEYCDHIKILKLGAGIATVGFKAFNECDGLERVIFADVDAWASIDFDGYEANPVFWSEAIYEGNELIDTLVISEGVKSIGVRAFYGFKGSAVVLPSTLESIGEYAFANTLITHITIPGGVKTVTSNAFYFSKLVSVTFEEGVETIQTGAFVSCGDLETVNFASTVCVVELNAFRFCDNAIVEVGGVRYVGTWAIGSVSNIENAVLRDGTVGIAQGAFKKRETLTAITLPDTLRYINEEAIYDTSITTLVIPDSVLKIGKDALYNNSYLRSLTIGKGVTSLDRGMLRSYELESLTIPFVGASREGTENTHIGYIFGAEDHTGNKTSLPETLKTIRVTDATTIATNAFYNCQSLTCIIISDTVTSIGSGAFKNVTALERITLPFIGLTKDSVGTKNFSKIFANSDPLQPIPTTLTHVTILGGERINAYDFYFCNSIEYLSLPATMKTFDFQAFGECTGLKIVNISDLDAWCRIEMADGNSNPLRASANAQLYLNGSPIGGSVELGDVEKIPYKTFSSCGLVSIVLPSTLTTIEEWAFSGCVSLVEIYNKSDLTLTIGSTENGAVAYYAKNIYGVNEGSSKLSQTDDGFVFYDDEGTYYLVDYVGESLEAVLPASCGGSEYILRNYAFYDRGDVISVDISSGVSEMQNNALTGCDGIKTLYLPYVGMEKLSLESVNTDFNLGYIFGSVRYNSTATAGAKVPESLKTVVIKGGTTIASAAFRNCIYIENVIIADTTLDLGVNVFENCTSLKSLHIPAAVRELSPDICVGCTSLESITVDPANSEFRSEGNCLIRKGSSGDTVYVGCKNSVIPTDGSITNIGRSAFNGCTGLESIVIPESVTTISGLVFNGCTNLTSVVFEDPTGWSVDVSGTVSAVDATALADPATAANYLKTDYTNALWKKLNG